MLQLEVNMVALDENNQYVVVLTDAEEKVALPIWIGAFEANAIALPLKNETLSRPLTHDLFISFCEETNSRIDKIIISNITADSTYIAEIHMVHNGENKVLDARPSDAIALALRTNAKIYMATKLIEFTHDLQDIFPGGADEGGPKH